jgi:hypothetical protein
MRETTTSKDLRWALAMTAAGVLAIFFALRRHWVPGDLEPGIEGCLTVTILGFVMALLHGLPYRLSLAISAPTVVALYLGCAYAAGPAIGAGMTGVQLAIMGLVGVVLSLGEPRAERDEPEAVRPLRAHRPAGAHT